MLIIASFTGQSESGEGGCFYEKYYNKGLIFISSRLTVIVILVNVIIKVTLRLSDFTGKITVLS